MTDLERAREALLKLSPIQAVTALVEAARREGYEEADKEYVQARWRVYEDGREAGAEEMREQAARVCEGGYTTGLTASTLEAVAAAIRALKEKN